jgi:hypothetical protein
VWSENSAAHSIEEFVLEDEVSSRMVSSVHKYSCTGHFYSDHHRCDPGRAFLKRTSSKNVVD